MMIKMQSDKEKMNGKRKCICGHEFDCHGKITGKCLFDHLCPCRYPDDKGISVDRNTNQTSKRRGKQ